MKKIIVFLIVGILAFSFSSLASEPFQISLPGTFGGSAILSCQDVHEYGGGDLGGVCSLTYDNFSTIPGYYFTGNLELSFSYLQGTTLWVDFNDSFQINDERGNPVFIVEFPHPVSFKINLIEGRVTEVMSFEVSGEPRLSINGNLVEATPDMLDYLFPIIR